MWSDRSRVWRLGVMAVEVPITGIGRPNPHFLTGFSMTRHSAWFGVVAVGLLATPSGAGEARLLRFPTIHGDRVAFTYAGNLYQAPAAGGVARRLTSHDGFEMFARFSPDGKWLAFTGQYDGNTDVYVRPAEGGTPRRLTW